MWRDLLQIGAGLTGYQNPALGLTLLAIGASGGLISIIVALVKLFRFLKRKAADSASIVGRTATRVRQKLIPLMLGTIAVAGALLVIGAVVGAIAYSSSQGQPESSPKTVYLKDAYIYGGTPSSSPRFSAKFARNGTRGRFYVDDSYYLGNFGPSGWTKRQRIPIAQPIMDFVAEQPINIPILTRVSGVTDTGAPAPASKLWRWGDGKTDIQTIYPADVQHQGRIVFISDDAPPEYFYFIILMGPVQETPTVIGHFNFDFIQEWESEDAKQK